MRSAAIAMLMAAGCGRIGFDALGGDELGDALGGDGLGGDAMSDFTTCPTSNGLVGYWPFDENGGTVANDMSSSGQIGDLNGSTTWTTGRLGSALQFGQNGNVVLRTAAGLSFGGGFGNFTITYWVAPDDLTSSDIRPLEFNRCSGTSYIVGWVATSGRVGFSGYDATNNYQTMGSTPSLQLGTWLHIALVLDRANGIGQTYVNGVASGSSANLSVWTDTIDCSGAMSAKNFGGWATFDYLGKMDDIRFYARALTPTEIDTLYHLPASGCPF